MAESMFDPGIVSWLASRDGTGAFVPHNAEGWHRFAHAAARIGLAGLMLQRAGALGVEFPPVTFRFLKCQAGSVAARNIGLMAELRRLTAALKRAGVDVMLLKGAALQLTIYDRPDLRPMSDLDVLVRLEQVDRAMAALEGANCRRGFELIRPDFFPEYYYEVEYLTDAPAPARIDLHARPLRPLRYACTLDEAAFWNDAVAADGADARVPAYSTMLLHLAAHAAFHDCDRLIWLYDIKRWVERYRDRIDWSRAVCDAERWRLTAAVHAAMSRAMAVFGAFGAEAFVEELAACGSSWRDRVVLAQAPRDASTPVRHVLINWLTTPGLVRSTRYVLAHVRPGKAHLAALYPYRHTGWTVCAHVCRVARALRRIAGVSVGHRFA